MKTLVAILSILSFLPLQVGVGCTMSEVSMAKKPSCHQKMQADSHKMASVEHGNQIKVKHSSDHSDCIFCQSGWCEGFNLVRKALFSSSEQELAMECRSPNLAPIPMELFLLPVPEPNTSPPGNKSNHLPILSFHSWQSYYSVYLI